MKILLISDSHGNKKALSNFLQTQTFDYTFFLGDGIRDVEGFDEIKVKRVCGNCDFFSSEAVTRFENIAGKKIMLTHGHDYRAKLTTSLMLQTAKQNYCDVVCFGHTHKQLKEIFDGILFVNPGAFKNGNYAILEIDQNGIITTHLKNLNKK